MTLRRFFLISLILGFLAAIGGGVFLVWGYFYVTRDLPQLEKVEDFRPPVVSQVFARDGKLVGEFFEERRYLVRIDQIPLHVRQAFLAAEDASFYQHPGIDFWSILRALKENIQEGRAKQGGSTITQQVVKNLLLTPEKKLVRKVKEAILSYQIEKRLSKDDILEIYLNQIFFGNTAYGIQAAAKLYYRKDVSELSIAEASILAGLPKAPSRFSPVLNPERARKRQQYVLRQMVKADFITEEQAEEALREKVKVYPASAQNIFDAPYYVSEVRRILQERWGNLRIDQDGYQIYTALNVSAHQVAERALRKGLRDVDKRRGWRGVLGTGFDDVRYQKEFLLPEASRRALGEPYPALVTAIRAGVVEVRLGADTHTVALKESAWANRRRNRDDSVSGISIERELRIGDVIEVSLREKKEAAGNTSLEAVLDQTPDLEGAVVLLDPYTGEVNVAVGGYDYGRSVFNRATQSLRQPGSAFKPVIYIAAIDQFSYTPATIVYDTPRTFKVGTQEWRPKNFDNKTVGGGITLRVALEKSSNLAAADIISRIGIDPVIQYAKKLGIESRLGRNLSLALGSSEVTVLELTRSYGPFAAKGVLADSIFITKILDRDGNVIFDAQDDKLTNARQVLPETSAFLMTNILKGVIESGTAQSLKALKRPAAGKTGTSNDEMDAWFVGYTPQWVAGVWVGFDVKKRIGPKETGGRVAAPIWLEVMQKFLAAQDQENYEKLAAESKAEAERLGIEYVPPEPLEPLDFSVPEGVEPFLIHKQSGLLADEGGPGVVQEYFVKGSQPRRAPSEEQTQQSYLEAPDL